MEKLKRYGNEFLRTTNLSDVPAKYHPLLASHVASVRVTHDVANSKAKCVSEFPLLEELDACLGRACEIIRALPDDIGVMYEVIAPDKIQCVISLDQIHRDVSQHRARYSLMLTPKRGRGKQREFVHLNRLLLAIINSYPQPLRRISRKDFALDADLQKLLTDIHDKLPGHHKAYGMKMSSPEEFHKRARALLKTSVK